MIDGLEAIELKLTLYSATIFHFEKNMTGF